MANQLGAGAPVGPAPPDRAEVMLAEARKALFVMVGFIAVIWILQIVNWASHYDFDTSYGVIPRDVVRLPDIFIAPFLHFSWSHIEANSGPLFIFGFLAAYRGVWKFVGLTVLVIITSGLAVWFFQGGNTVGVGASGLVFGYFGYVLARGLIDRNLIDALIAIVMGLSFAYLFTVAIPGTPHVSWLAHLGGLIGGLAGGWIFRDRKSRGRAGQKPKRGTGTGNATSAGGGGGSGGETKPLPVAADNPRADLHRELGELGL